MIPRAVTASHGFGRRSAALLGLVPLAMLAAWGGLAAGLPEPPKQGAVAAPVAAKDRLLVFSKTGGFRHDSIPDGIACVRELLGDRYEVDASEDAAVFTPANLARYKAVVFLSTTGDILDADQQKAFEEFIHLGGGFAGIHAAADTEHTWPWYGKLVGAYFNTHPDIQEALVRVEDRTHPSTVMLPENWRRTDEWYVYKSNPRGQVKVLANLDTTTIRGETMGGDHPIAWFHDFEGGRAWYTGGGHTKESYTEPLFRAHIKGGVLWAAGAETAPVPAREAGKPADSSAQPPSPSAAKPVG